MGAELAKAEGRRDLPQESHHVNMFDETLRIRVVLGPEVDKLPEVMGAEDGPVPGEVVEVVHDDGDEQVEDKESADNEEADEERVGHIGAATFLLPSIVRLGSEVWGYLGEICLTWKIVVLSVGASAAALTSFFFLNLLK